MTNQQGCLAMTTILLALRLLSGAPSASLDALYDAIQYRQDIECAGLSEDRDTYSTAELPLDCALDMLGDAS